MCINDELAMLKEQMLFWLTFFLIIFFYPIKSSFCFLLFSVLKKSVPVSANKSGTAHTLTVRTFCAVFRGDFLIRPVIRISKFEPHFKTDSLTIPSSVAKPEPHFDGFRAVTQCGSGSCFDGFDSDVQIQNKRNLKVLYNEK
jgi:hypothetical protein